jgi:PAS domain S-box-containing protein
VEQHDNFRSSFNTEARYRLLVEAVTDYAIYMLDPDGYVVSWNTGAQRLKGYTESEILGSHFSRFYPQDDVRVGMPARTLATAAHEGRFEAEGWRVAKGGRRFWAHVMVDPIRSASGELLGYAKVTRDLTERRVAEESLRRSEEHFRLLVQGVIDYAIYMLDPHGVVTSWNAGAQRIKGYLPNEAIGSHFSRFYRPEDKENGEPEKALATAAREGRFESEGWRVRKDGTQFWANVVVDPIRDGGGTIIGYAKVTRDVTEKRRAAQELDRAREALFQSQKLDAIGQLTGGVAHDFNNLLMVVLSSLELARRRLPEDEKLRNLIENAVKGAKRGVCGERARCDA